MLVYIHSFMVSGDGGNDRDLSRVNYSLSVRCVPKVVTHILITQQPFPIHIYLKLRDLRYFK